MHKRAVLKTQCALCIETWISEILQESHVMFSHTAKLAGKSSAFEAGGQIVVCHSISIEFSVSVLISGFNFFFLYLYVKYLFIFRVTIHWAHVYSSRVSCVHRRYWILALSMSNHVHQLRTQITMKECSSESAALFKSTNHHNVT